MPMDYPSLPAGAFIGAVLVLIPLPWHWRARNVGTLAIIAWLFVMNMIYFVNTIVWAGNVNNPAPVWCDITTKLIIGANTALPIATMCVCKHLELVSSTRRVSLDSRDKKRRIIFDSIMCFGLPLIFMALHYVVQGHRFDIIENFGCQPATYYSIPGVMIVWVPPLFFSVATLVYASIALTHFIRRRMCFAAHLQNSNSALTTNRYLRLMIMAVTEMVWGTALTSFNMYGNVSPGLRPWISWANVHSNFSRVALYGFIEIPAPLLSQMFLFWWAMPASAFIFFLFFGFGEEARKEYGRIFTWIRRHVFRQSIAENKYGLQLPSSRAGHLAQIPTLPPIVVISKDDEKCLSPISTSSTLQTSTKYEKAELSLANLSYDSQDISSPASYSSSDLESGHRTSFSSSHFSGGRAYTTSTIVEAGAFSPQRPFSPPSIYPLMHPNAQTRDQQADNLV